MKINKVKKQREEDLIATREVNKMNLGNNNSSHKIKLLKRFFHYD